LVITLDPHQVPPTVACDVDTLDDLAHASALGLGALTRRIADSLGSPHD
jgi:2-phospho-L-lactate guanylyltransferase (CobY/MobA/RfbA family)